MSATSPLSLGPKLRAPKLHYLYIPMSDTNAKSVMDLRLRTGLGVMECKRALVESGNDVEQAIDYLRRASKIKTAKKSARVAAEGVAITSVNKERTYGIMLELNSETDFVARDANFIEFAERLATEATQRCAENTEQVMSADMQQARESLVQKVGENIQLRRVHTMRSEEGGIWDYTHSNKRIAVLTHLSGGSPETGRDIAMHIAAMTPLVVRPEEMPEALIAKEREVYAAQTANTDKPADVVEKIIAGKIGKYIAAHSVLEQAFVKQPDTTIGKWLKEHQAQIHTFMRYEVGEGTEKNTVDFATEVAQQAGLHGND